MCWTFFRVSGRAGSPDGGEEQRSRRRTMRRTRDRSAAAVEKKYWSRKKSLQLQ
jgi:hypothetical protein